MDQIFKSSYLPEWYQGGEVSSAHDANSIKTFEVPLSYVLFCYPRDNTPVCTSELIALQKELKKFNLPVIAASTDSPESHSLFFNNDEAFPPEEVLNIEYPVLTLRDNLLTVYGNKIIMNEYGYCKRVALVIRNEVVKGLYETDSDTSRDISVLLGLVNTT